VSRVLVIGGYGGFGAHLSRRLAGLGFDVIVAGRSLARAEAFCREVAGCCPAQADRNEGLADRLASEAPDIVIDASGPFQSTGYGVIAACIAAGISYVDLADARDFVTGITRFDQAARDAGVAVVSGASSVPALSGAVARRLATGLERVTSVEIAISASSRASVGPSVAKAILGGVGRPICVWRGGRRIVRHGWQELRRERFTVAGGADLGGRLVALADVPDLALLPPRLAGQPAVTFRAGTESRLAVAALWFLSWPVRLRGLRSLSPLARALVAMHRWTGRWGGNRSGMIVRLFGRIDGRRVERTWTLIADAGDGPQIPALPAAIVALRIARGEMSRGAYDAGSALELDAFAPLFATIAVRHSVVETELPPPLYQRVMGAAFDRLAPAVRSMHDVLRDSGAEGRGQVERGRHPFARLVAALMRFPTAGEHPLHVHFAEARGAERWTRDFGGHCFASILRQAGDALVERFGPMRFHFQLREDRRTLRMILTRWSFLGIRLPLALAPRIAAQEWEKHGLFHFDVRIDLPLVGQVIRYRGWLRPLACA
jgi:hypothetical protein